jgi:cytochrome c
MNKSFVLGAAFMLSAIICKAQTPVAKIPADIDKLLQSYTCLACHRVDAKLIGPAYQEVAKKKYTKEQIVELIYTPKPSNWPGYPPMTPMKHVPKDEALKIASWIVSLASNKK